MMYLLLLFSLCTGGGTSHPVGVSVSVDQMSNKLNIFSDMIRVHYMGSFYLQIILGNVWKIPDRSTCHPLLLMGARIALLCTRDISFYATRRESKREGKAEDFSLAIENREHTHKKKGVKFSLFLGGINITRKCTKAIDWMRKQNNVDNIVPVAYYIVVPWFTVFYTFPHTTS